MVYCTGFKNHQSAAIDASDISRLYWLNHGIRRYTNRLIVYSHTSLNTRRITDDKTNYNTLFRLMSKSGRYAPRRCYKARF